MTTPPAAPSGQLLAALQDGKLAGTWNLDATRSTVQLYTKSLWGLMKIKGCFTSLAGEATITEAGQVTGNLTIDAASIDTKIAKRDEHLRSAHFFDTERHPSIVFSATGIGVVNGGLVASGGLTVRGVTRPLSVPLAAADLGEAVQLTAQITIDRTEFGLAWNQLGMASNLNLISVTAVFTPQG